MLSLTTALIVYCRKDQEISSLNGKLEEEQNLVAQLQKKIKELQVS